MTRAAHLNSFLDTENIGGGIMRLKALGGSGDKIMLFTLQFLIIGLILNIMIPSFFSVGFPRASMGWFSI